MLLLTTANASYGTENPQEILVTVARKIEHIPEKRERSNIAASTAVLAGLLYSRDVITKILRQDIRHLLKRNSRIIKGSVIVHILGFCEDFKCWNIRDKLRVVQAIADFRG